MFRFHIVFITNLFSCNPYYFPFDDIFKKKIKTSVRTPCLWVFTQEIHPFFKYTNRRSTAFQNETVPFVLAYRVRLFFEINDTTTFYLVWIYQAPVLYMGIWHTAAIGLVFSLVLHLCGQISVLSFKIRNLDLGDRENDQTFGSIFQDIVVKHRKILE